MSLEKGTEDHYQEHSKPSTIPFVIAVLRIKIEASDILGKCFVMEPHPQPLLPNIDWTADFIPPISCPASEWGSQTGKSDSKSIKRARRGSVNLLLGAQ